MAMNKGIGIQELVKRIQEEDAKKSDFLAHTRALSVMSTTQDGTLLDLGAGVEYMPLNSWAHGQMAEHLGIPKAYYDKMRENMPELLDQNINGWLHAAPVDERRLVRTLDGDVRAILSNKYRQLDNVDLARFVLPQLSHFQGIQVESSQITEQRLYLKLALPSIQREVTLGDVVQMGILVQNSEVGAGGFTVMPWSKRLVCLNGMTHEDAGVRRNHAGKAKITTVSDVEQYYSDETQRQSDKALFMQAGDVVRGILSERMIDNIVAKMREAAGVQVEQPEASIEMVARRSSLTDDETKLIFQAFIENRDHSLWGVANAVTQVAGTIEDYDRSTALEHIGGRIIDLPASEWREIARATTDNLPRKRTTRGTNTAEHGLIAAAALR